jgi:hypothetical protein
MLSVSVSKHHEPINPRRSRRELDGGKVSKREWYFYLSKEILDSSASEKK